MALRFQQLAVQAARDAGNELGVLVATAEHGWIWLHRGELERSYQCFHSAAGRFVALESPSSAQSCWLGLAEVARMGGDYPQAREWLERVVEQSSTEENRWTLAAQKHFQSNLARSEGDLETADAYMFEAGRLYAESGSAGVRVANLNRGLLLLAKQDFDEGMALLETLFPGVPRERVPVRVQVRCGLCLRRAFWRLGQMGPSFDGHHQANRQLGLCGRGRRGPLASSWCARD